MSPAIEKLNNAWARISRIEQTIAVLSWDMETYMPVEGVKPRAEQLALLSELSHRWLISDETGRLIEDAEAETRGSDYFSIEASLVRAARRAYDQKKKLPEELVTRLARTTAQANSIWIRAREEASFPAFAPVLSELVAISRDMADLLGSTGHRYDALLDLYEPDLTTAEVERLFGELKTGLIPLVKEITARKSPADTAFLTRTYDTGRQEAFGLRVLGDMKFDFNRGRQDRSAHPFTTSFTPYDVRITTRYSEDDLLSALFSTIHEAGHALYDMGLPLDLLETPLCQPISLGVHESQSRLWENIVGRSRGFWKHYLPILKEHFHGQLDDVGLQQFYAAVNTSRPGFIRVESDELTYNLHIFIRFEIEKELIGGSLSVKQIPSLWNETYQDYLGIVPPNDALGCLQDIHWAHGSFGYFPTYTIGNLLSAQLYRAAIDACPSIPGDIKKGNFIALLEWLRENVHRHGSRYTSAELVKNITGGGIQVGPFMRYLADKFHEVYSLS
ncbi:MAG TPA: carboxypeptidase M32 [Spirochaetota bacterium]|nr:carboxypeptidase M32 [Spirochaetota bacterium]HOD16017.1 carboxypeptidase M32 [Spirochaetota bacterium]HPG50088.1 carboxypeptidase M32 [Spirochaetota bacterium]HPN12244.1 carboxypeptidase M32 [Spirochaetota bacterium]